MIVRNVNQQQLNSLSDTILKMFNKQILERSMFLLGDKYKESHGRVHLHFNHFKNKSYSPYTSGISSGENTYLANIIQQIYDDERYKLILKKSCENKQELLSITVTHRMFWNCDDQDEILVRLKSLDKIWSFSKQHEMYFKSIVLGIITPLVLDNHNIGLLRDYLIEHVYDNTFDINICMKNLGQEHPCIHITISKKEPINNEEDQSQPMNVDDDDNEYDGTTTEEEDDDDDLPPPVLTHKPLARKASDEKLPPAKRQKISQSEYRESS